MIRELWKGVGVPRSLYGYEVCKVTKNEIDRMERIQNRVARMALGSNSFVAIEALRGEMGWSTYEERVSKMKLKYKVKLHGLGENNWAGYVFRECQGTTWHKEIKSLERKYDLRNVYESENAKVCVDRGVRAKWQQIWENGVNRKSTLSVYKHKKHPCVEELYEGDWKSQLLFKARSGSLEVNGRTYRWSGKSENCEWCALGVKETVEHLILKCSGHELERMNLNESMKEVIGSDKWNEFSTKEDEGLSIVLGFECEDESVNRSRMKVAEIAKTFLKSVWSKRE